MFEHLANIIDSANEGLYVTDKDRKFLLWNKAAESITGYRKDEILGRSCFDDILNHCTEDGHELCKVKCPLAASIEDGKPRGPALVYLRHKSGKRVAVEVRTAPFRNKAGKIVGGVEVFQDVTERLLRERLLKERKEELETVLNNIGEGILFVDTEGDLSVVNRASTRLLNIPGDALGTPLHSLPADTPVGQALMAIEETFRSSSFMSTDETVVCCPKGQGRFRCWTAAMDSRSGAPRSPCFTCTVYKKVRTFLEKPQEFESGDRTFSIVSSFLEYPETNDIWEIIVFHDVTSEKLDAALKVAGAAAHELRQPLQAVVILAGMLAEELRDNPEMKKNIKSLLKSCTRMNNIVQRMSEITRYKTVDYLGGKKILDLSRSADTEESWQHLEGLDSSML